MSHPIETIYRYPLKGFSPDPLDKVTLEAGKAMPWDRAFAIENGTRDVDPEAPAFFPKVKFLQLMQFARLATLEVHFDADRPMLRFARDGKSLVQGDPTTPIGRQLIEQFMAAYFEEELRGAPRLVYAPDHTFSDVSLACISFINLTSVDDVARVFGRPVDPLRFRGNIYFRTDNPWEEKAWIGKHLTVGETRFEVVEGIVRCAATNVDPATAERDGNMPRLLQDAFGANELGVYAKVVDGGKIAVGDTIAVG